MLQARAGSLTWEEGIKGIAQYLTPLGPPKEALVIVDILVAKVKTTKIYLKPRLANDY